MDKEKLLVLRKEYFKMSRKEFARMLGVSETCICRYETGSRKIPKPFRYLLGYIIKNSLNGG